MKYRHPMFLDKQDAVLVVVDIQEKLFKTMAATCQENILKNVPILLAAADELEIPVIVSEQYPRGIGPTIAPLKKKITKAEYIEKVDFAATEVNDFTKALAKAKRRQVILVGMETHICVYQTALGLLELGFDVHVPEDALASRIIENYDAGVSLLLQAGAVVSSTEAILFQLLKRSGSESFKRLQKLII